MLRHLAVHEPDALSLEPWQSHVRECAACGTEWRAFAASLAVYCRIEQDHAARLTAAPSWDAFAGRMQEQRAARRRASAIMAPWLAGMVGLFVVGGIFSWGLWSNSGAPIPTPLVVQEDLLAPRKQERGRQSLSPSQYSASQSGSARTAISDTAGRRGMAVAQWGSIWRTPRLLEPHSLVMGRPSGEVVILPFGHDRLAIPYVMPVASVSTSSARRQHPTGYGAPSPVR
jgi:hypothetical protein